MPRRLSASLILALAAGSLSGLREAHADPPGLWPIFRHDSQRTGRADGVGAITRPEVAWTLSTGGSLAARQTAIADVDGDGRNEVVLASGGAILVRHADDSIVTRSRLFGADYVYGVWNLDGVGAPEIVAHGRSPRGVYAINAATGDIQWQVPMQNEFVGAMPVPVAGGGFDLILRDYTDRTVLTRVRSSVGGGTVAIAWTAEIPIYDIIRSTGLADMDGDGTPEVIAPIARGFSVRNVATGTEMFRADVIPNAAYEPIYDFYYTTANVDGRPGDEIIALDVSYYYSEDASLSVLGVRPGGTGNALTVLWQRYIHNDVTPGSGNDVGVQFFRMLADGVVDLDRDGMVELVFSQWDGRMRPGTWTTFVVDGASGTEITRRTGVSCEAVADLDNDGRAEIVLRDATDASAVANAPTPLFATLRGYDFDSRAMGMVDRGWMLENAGVVHLPAWQRRRGSYELGGYFAGALLMSAHQDIDGTMDPAEELYVYYNQMDEFTNQQRPTHIMAVHGMDGAIRARWPIPPATFASVLQLGQRLASSTAPAEALVGVNDGRARVISSAFMDVGTLTEGNFARMPAVVSLDTRTTLVAAVESAEFLVLADPRHSRGASPDVPYRIRGAILGESRGYVNQPGAIVPADDGSGNQLVVRAHSLVNWQDQALVAINFLGREVWRTEVGHGRSVAGFDNAVSADFDGDRSPDFFLTEISDMGTQELVVRRGVGGRVIRSLPVGPTLSMGTEMINAGAYFQGYAAVDVNGDRVPDIVGALHPQWFVALDVSATPIRSVWVRRGTPAAIVNGQAMIGPLAVDGSPRVLRTNSQNAYGPYTRFALDGTIEATVAPPGIPPLRDYMDPNNAAFIARSGSPARVDFVTAGATNAAAGVVTRFDGDTMMPLWQRHLANGIVSAAAPAQSYALYDPIAADIDGDGSDEVLVGSDDGRLYALRGGDGALLFSIDLRSPVVHVLAANLDEDADLEILCALLDGTLRALDQPGSYRWQPVAIPDAGVTDASGSDASAADAGAVDASFDASATIDARGDAGPTPAPSGCGCRTIARTSRSSTSGLAILAIGSAIVILRRRRRRERASRTCTDPENVL